MLGHREVVRVEYPASTIVGRIDQYNDMLVGRPGEEVVQLAEVQCREVALTIEGVKMRAELSVPPDPLGGNGSTALG